MSQRQSSPVKKTTRPTHTPPIPHEPQKDTLLDFGISENKTSLSSQSSSGTNALPNPFQFSENDVLDLTRVPVRTEEQQQAAARDREEKSQTETQKDSNARRDARRKSLANRRVSFAPEATLHTWDIPGEDVQDSTTSSASTNSTRRASAMSTAVDASLSSDAPGPFDSSTMEPPSTPPEQEDDTVIGSPAHQRDLHQKKHRRASGIPPMNFNNPDDDILSSSPYSGCSAVGSDDAEEAFIDSSDIGDMDSDNSSDAQGTMMDLDGEDDSTNMSMASVRSGASTTGTSARLKDALHQASRQTEAHDNEIGQDGHCSMEDGDGGPPSPGPIMFPYPTLPKLSSFSDQENLNPFSPAFKAGLPLSSTSQIEADDMTMDMTRAVGRILPQQKVHQDGTNKITETVDGTMSSRNPPPLASERRKSMTAGRRRSLRRSSGYGSSQEDETMDLTIAIGGIQSNATQEFEVSDASEDEDMTMEFTSVIGGVLQAGKLGVSRIAPTKLTDTASVSSPIQDATMDITMAAGRILPSTLSHNPHSERQEENDTIDMDMTTAVGGILSLPTKQNRVQAKQLMEEEGDAADSIVSPLTTTRSPPKQKTVQDTRATSETGSPSLSAFNGRGLRHSGRVQKAITSSRQETGTPLKKPTTPAKQLTPKPTRPTTPGKTPPSKNIVMRTASPKRLFVRGPKAGPTAPNLGTPTALGHSATTTPNGIFRQDGKIAPTLILTPRRKSTGLGIDKEGLGSPRIAAILDRRGSIGDMAPAFAIGKSAEMAHTVRFDNPRKLEREVDQEREQVVSVEDGRAILEREADSYVDEKDATINLKEMIESLTPKKKPLKGRKSLHVGTAKGLLGKRPAELDDDEGNDQDDEDQFSMKRLKGHQGSPVKNVKLQAPPPKEDTIGRMTRAGRRSFTEGGGNLVTPTIGSSPGQNIAITTPRGQGRFRDAEESAGRSVLSLKIVPDEVLEDNVHENIHLQDFLNMTSIRFMELTTTKRRHTMAVSSLDDNAGKDSSLETGKTAAVLGTELESCVVAGACTVPMLELYQHVGLSYYCLSQIQC